MDLPEPPRPDQKAYPPAPQAPAPPGPGSKWKPSTSFIVAMVVAGLVVLGAIISAFDGDSGGGSTSSDSSNALTERTCEIARDISADVSDGVDTIPEARERFKDLLDGYGVSAPADISGPLRQIVASLTQGETTQLEVAVGNLHSACASRGF
jgi:hypothetical protein